MDTEKNTNKRDKRITNLYLISASGDILPPMEGEPDRKPEEMEAAKALGLTCGRLLIAAKRHPSSAARDTRAGSSGNERFTPGVGCKPFCP